MPAAAFKKSASCVEETRLVTSGNMKNYKLTKWEMPSITENLNVFCMFFLSKDNLVS